MEEHNGYRYTHYRCKGNGSNGCHDWTTKTDAKTGETMVSSLSPCICCGENTFKKIGEEADKHGKSIFQYLCDTCELTATRVYGNRIDRVAYHL